MGAAPPCATLIRQNCSKLLQVLLKDGPSHEGCRRVESGADVTVWAWLDALPVASNCLLEDGDVVPSLQYILEVCTAVMQDTSLVCE